MFVSRQCLTATDRFSVIFLNPFSSLQGSPCLCTLLEEAGQAAERMSAFDDSCPRALECADQEQERKVVKGSTSHSVGCGMLKTEVHKGCVSVSK